MKIYTWPESEFGMPEETIIMCDRCYSLFSVIKSAHYKVQSTLQPGRFVYFCWDHASKNAIEFDTKEEIQKER